MKLTTPEGTTEEIALSETALRTVRRTFNPSGQTRVDRIKLLAAALISEAEAIRDEPGADKRCAALAITNIETGAMYAVKAATA